MTVGQLQDTPLRNNLVALGFDFYSDRGGSHGGFWVVEEYDRLQEPKVLPAIFKQNSRTPGMNQWQAEPFPSTQKKKKKGSG